MSTCNQCGGEYYAPPSHRKFRSYCSRACRAKAQSDWQRRDVSERFWGKVNKTDSCWLWTGAASRSGYGQLRVDKKVKMAHRLAYELLVGQIPDGLFLLHSCDTPACCNPAHLKPGTQMENIHDAIGKKRHCHGERHWKCKLSDADVATIRAAGANGGTGRSLAKRFGVSEGAISMILTEKKRKRPTE